MEMEKDEDRNWRLIQRKAVKARFGYVVVDVDRSAAESGGPVRLLSSRDKGGEGERIFETHIFLL